METVSAVNQTLPISGRSSRHTLPQFTKTSSWSTLEFQDYSSLLANSPLFWKHIKSHSFVSVFSFYSTQFFVSVKPWTCAYNPVQSQGSLDMRAISSVVQPLLCSSPSLVPRFLLSFFFSGLSGSPPSSTQRQTNPVPVHLSYHQFNILWFYEWMSVR